MISILLPDLSGGGAERVMLDLAREFSRYGHEVDFVLLRADGDFLSDAQRDFQVVDLSSPKTRGAILPIAQYLKHRKPDCVIANMWPLTSAAVLGRALSGHSCTLLVVEHNTLSQQYASWGALHSLKIKLSMTATYRFADRVAAVSEGSAIDTARLAWLPAHGVNVLHNPIPQHPMPSLAERALVERMWACPPGKRILTVGKLKDQKNHPLLLRAFAMLAHPDARLMILGQGENGSMLRSIATDLGITDRLIFAGFHLDPAPFYATADLFALSSDYEGLPTVLIEALSFGLPVVSTDCPSGPSEILQDGRFGHLVPVGDTAALAHAMGIALETSVNRDAQIRRAADFAPEVAARRYLDLLRLRCPSPPT